MCTYLDKVESTYYFRRPVPKDLVGHFATQSGATRTEWKVSLRVKDREAAKRLLPRYVEETSAMIDKARFDRASQPSTAMKAAPAPHSVAGPSFQAATALAGEAWQREIARERDIEETRRDDDPLYDLHARNYELLDRQEERERDARFNADLRRELAKEARQAASVDVMALFERYAAVPGRNPKTMAQWRPYLQKLVVFTGLSDASQLTPGHIRDWRNHLRDIQRFRGRSLSASTINGSYLAAVNVVFGWAVDDGVLAENPALGVKPVKLPSKPVGRSRAMTDEEAATILTASLLGRVGSEGVDFVNAKRWIPWILCYTGARVNEITQLRKQDVRQVAGIPCIAITPDAGRVKSKRARIVPVHPDLVRQGFLDFVADRSDGPLFFNPAKRRSDNAINRQANRLGSKLAEWVRGLGVTAPQPNHAWRHRFVNSATRYRLTERASEAITGHSSGKQHRAYGDNEVDILLEQISKLPSFEL